MFLHLTTFTLLLTTSLALAAPFATSVEPTKVTVMATPTAPSNLYGRQAETWLPWTPAWTEPGWTMPAPSASQSLTPLQKSTALEGAVLVAVILASLLAFGILGCVLHCCLRNSSSSCCSRSRSRKVAAPCVEHDAGLDVEMTAGMIRKPEAVVIATPCDSEGSEGPHVTWTRGQGFVKVQ